MDCICFLLLSIKFLRRLLPLLVNVLLQINIIHAWDILLLELFVMFFLGLSCLLVQIKLFTPILLVSIKSKQLPFALSCTQVNFPLELIFTDVWGLSPICSKSGSKYYVSFMDAYSRYNWLYPMTNKSDVLSIFIKWQK